MDGSRRSFRNEGNGNRDEVEIRHERGTYEIEVEDLMIPSTRYPNDFSFLYISHRAFHTSMYPRTYPIAAPGQSRDTPEEKRGRRVCLGEKRETYLLNNFNPPTLILDLSHIEDWFPILQYSFDTIRGEQPP
jgi:hypothetical protein